MRGLATCLGVLGVLAACSSSSSSGSSSGNGSDSGAGNSSGSGSSGASSGGTSGGSSGGSSSGSGSGGSSGSSSSGTSSGSSGGSSGGSGSGSGSGSSGGSTQESKYVYAGSYADTGIAGFSLNTSTGALTAVAGSPFGGTGAGNPAVTPAGTFLYAVPSSGAGLLGFSVAPSTGVLTALTGSPFDTSASTAAPDGSSGMLIDRTGKFLYVPAAHSPQILGFSIASTGALSPLAGSPFSLGTATGTIPYAPIIDPSSKFLFVPSNIATGTVPSPGLSAYTIDSTSGALTPVAGSPFAISAFGLAVDPATKYLFATNSDANTVQVFTIGSSGALTEISGSPFGSGGENPVTLVVNPAGTVLYVGNNGTTTTVNAFTIGASGALTASGTGVSAPNPQSMAIDTLGKFLFVSDGGNNNLNVFSIDPSSGALTITSGSPYVGGGGLGVITAP